MSQVIVWLILLVAIIFKAASKGKLNQEKRPNTSQPQYQQPVNNRPQPMPNQQMRRQPVPNQQMRQQYVNPYQDAERNSSTKMSQEELKAKLQQRFQTAAAKIEEEVKQNIYGQSQKMNQQQNRQQQNSKPQQVYNSERQEDILSRANRNTDEYKEDELHEEQCGEHLDNAQMHKVDFSEFDQETVLGDVEDLMIKGYNGNIDFGRDFVGEGLDMLNSFVIPDEVPDTMSFQSSN